MHAAAFAFLAAVALVAAIVPPTGASSPAPSATTVPFALPMLEGAQAKVEIGRGAPNGDATSYWGNQGAVANFSVWWWDTGAPTQARVVFDQVAHPMSPAPVGDGDDSNGTLYVAAIDVATMAAGDHEWYFDFSGPSGGTRLPASSNFTNLRLDLADRFLNDPLMVSAQQVNFGKRAGTIPTLREAVNRTMLALGPPMSTHWDNATGYPYTDLNRHIIQPSGATVGNLEAYVTSTGASRARYTDGLNFTNNSQPAIKQALAMRGLLLATALFNASEIEVWTETMVVAPITYTHPFLRVALADLSEEPGDGPVDGDGWMDVDLWGAGLPAAVPFGSHFGEDFAAANDALWDGSIVWPPSPDSATDYVLAPYESVSNVTLPDGTDVSFYMYASRVNAGTTSPLIYSTYWTDEPVVFDGLSTTQSAFVDLNYAWAVENTPWSGSGPVWVQAIQAVGNYTATLTVRDAFGQVDQVTIPFYIHGKTKARVPIQDVTFPEDGRHALDLRAYFTDDDGFSTIQFSFSADPAGTVQVDRTSPTAFSVNITSPRDWWGVARVWINGTDGVSPPVAQGFNVTVTPVNDAPTVSGLPGAISFTEDTTFVLGPLSANVTDPDQDTLTWAFVGGTEVAAVFEPANDSLVFSAAADWSGVNSGTISVTDGKVWVNRTLVVQVLAGNDAPRQIAPIPSPVVFEDAANATFLLGDFFDDPDGESLSAQVTPSPGVEAGYSAPLREFWFRPAAEFSGPTSFTVRVWDAAGENITVVVSVTVLPVNDAPRIGAVDPSGYVSAAEGDRLGFAVTAADADSPTLTYAFDLDGEAQGASFLGTFDWQTGYQSAGRHTLTVNVTDGAGGVATHSWSIQVADRNRPPSVSIVRPAATRFDTGESIALSANGIDPDSDSLTYTWSFGGALQPLQGREITVRFNSEGNYTVKVTVNDGRLTATDETTLVVVYVAPYIPPNNNTTPPNVTTPPGFLPAPGAQAAVAAVAAAAILLAVSARRRR